MLSWTKNKTVQSSKQVLPTMQITTQCLPTAPLQEWGCITPEIISFECVFCREKYKSILQHIHATNKPCCLCFLINLVSVDSKPVNYIGTRKKMCF